MCRLTWFLFFIFGVVTAIRKVELSKKPLQTDFVGCPTENDFYYNGTIFSPLWPANYPPNDKCYYFITAERGYVLSFEFPHFDLETCCDYVTIYDGDSEEKPILARFGGPKATTHTPVGKYYTTTRNALVTFTSDAIQQQSGFEMIYRSEYTTTPCNRDILLTINGMATLGSQANFVKELNFLANLLTPTWNVSATGVRVMINFQVDNDYAVVFSSDEMPNNTLVTQTIESLTEYVPDVMQNNVTSLNGLFRYTESALSGESAKEMGAREGIENIAIVFVAHDANNDQDFYEATEYAHLTKTHDDTKVIIVAMGTGLDTKRLARLAYSSQFVFAADYDALHTLLAPINDAICKNLAPGCGA